MDTFQIQYIADGKRYVLLMTAKNEQKALKIMENALKNEFESYEIRRIIKL